MDVEAFHAFTAAEAGHYLASLLETERRIVDAMAESVCEVGTDFNYSMTSLPECLKWWMRQMRMHPVPVHPEIPKWIASSSPHLLEFDNKSKSLLLRGGYYLGECFARQPGLRWGTGHPEFMHRNMPVITGFEDGQELPPLLVYENLCARVLELAVSESSFDSVIASWQRSVKGR